MEAERKVYQCDANNIGCPRVRLLQKLIASGDIMRASTLLQKDYTPTPDDIKRSQRMHGPKDDENQRVIPLTCDFTLACMKVVNEMSQPVTGPSMPGLGPRPIPGTRS